MPSRNSITNHALDLLGEPSVDDYTDAVERAERIAAAWDDTRDALLRAYLWSFAIERASLAADSTAPTWGFARQFTIDGDVVRLVQVDQYYPPASLSDYVGTDSAPYRREGNKILTDIAAPLKVRWVINSVDVGSWDPCFARVMACDLADRYATRGTGSESIKQRIKSERSDALIQALRANAIETPPTAIGDGSWMASRLAV